MHDSFNGYLKKRKISYSKSGCGCKQKRAEHKAKAAGFACPITCKVIAAFPSEPDASTIFDSLL